MRGCIREAVAIPADEVGVEYLPRLCRLTLEQRLVHAGEQGEVAMDPHGQVAVGQLDAPAGQSADLLRGAEPGQAWRRQRVDGDVTRDTPLRVLERAQRAGGGRARGLPDERDRGWLAGAAA